MAWLVAVLRKAIGPGVDIPDIPMDKIRDASSFPIAEKKGRKGWSVVRRMSSLESKTQESLNEKKI